jgi:hypothetical protein
VPASIVRACGTQMPGQRRRKGRRTDRAAHVAVDNFDRSFGIPRTNKGETETPVHVIWIERHRFFECNNSCVVLMLAGEDKPQHSMGMKVSMGLAARPCARSRTPLKNCGVEIVFVLRVDPVRNVGIGEGRVRAGVVRVDVKRLVEQAPHFLNISEGDDEAEASTAWR